MAGNEFREWPEVHTPSSSHDANGPRTYEFSLTDKDKLAGEADTIIRLSKQYLITVTAFDFLVGVVNTVRFTIQGMGFSNFAMIAGLLEMVARSIAGIVLIPMIGFAGACFSSPLAWIFADAFLVPAYFWCKKRLSMA